MKAKGVNLKKEGGSRKLRRNGHLYQRPEMPGHAICFLNSRQGRFLEFLPIHLSPTFPLAQSLLGIGCILLPQSWWPRDYFQDDVLQKGSTDRVASEH